MSLLLERDPLLTALGSYLDEALGGRGRLVFLGGEAGAGKTALVTHFAEHLDERARALRGATDGGTAPRPLGPLADVAPALGSAVTDHLSDDRPNRGRLFHPVLDALATQPTFLLLEDVHWADEATLDLVRFLGRRIDTVPVLIVATFRDDEVGASHPLTVVMGDLATSAVVARMQMPPLTQSAVAELARRSQPDIDPSELHRQTGGNAFFVTEALAADTGGRVPPSVRDAMLARAARLSPAAHEVLAAASVIGLFAEPDVLIDVSAQPLDAVDECIGRGLLIEAGERIGFRHELARLAIEHGLSAATRVRLHRAVLDRLLADGITDDRRLAHHAEHGGDADAAIRHSSRAAEQAARLGSHRESAEHYRVALRHARLLPDSVRSVEVHRVRVNCSSRRWSSPGRPVNGNGWYRPRSPGRSRRGPTIS